MNDAQAFEEIKRLAGDWRVTHDHGRISTVNYCMSCNNTVLVERWALKADMESMTLFHMDSGKLIATHYCPLGNQPRLEFAGSDGEKLLFKTVSVTDLNAPEDEHCTAVDFQFLSSNSVVRNETYTAKNIDAVETGTFTRCN